MQISYFFQHKIFQLIFFYIINDLQQTLQIYILFKEGLHVWKKRLFNTAVDIKKIGFLNSETDSYVNFTKKIVSTSLIYQSTYDIHIFYQQFA